MRYKIVCVILAAAIAINIIGIFHSMTAADEPSVLPAVSDGDYIKWVEYQVPLAAMEKALELDIAAHTADRELPFARQLAYLAAKYGGNWKNYKAKHLDELSKEVENGKTIEELVTNKKGFAYYKEAYSAAVGGLVGEYKIAAPENLSEATEVKYGLRAYSPIAHGYSYSHTNDFGVSRSFGFSRRHLGNDLFGSVGTPIIAVESGTIANIGWNRYGGWRIGIRSHDGKRYYYYAHLRRKHPFAKDFKVGDSVFGGDVIGYLGMTGYSDKEDVNGMQIPHLHFGLELVFDESQLESDNEIWIDVYNIVNLLKHHTSPVVKSADDNNYVRKYAYGEELAVRSEE